MKVLRLSYRRLMLLCAC